MRPSLSDEHVAASLLAFTRIADLLLIEPGKWVDATPATPAVSGIGRALNAAKNMVLGDTAPGAPGWSALPLQDRVEWWVDRISNFAAIPAAAPSAGGFIASKFNTQDLLGAAGAGLTVCAVAQEYGVREPPAWVPIVSQVVFNRHLQQPNAGADPPIATHRFQRPTSTTEARELLRQMSDTIKNVGSLLDERPKGGLFARGLSKVPVAGVAGGFLAERKAMRRAADEAEALLSRR